MARNKTGASKQRKKNEIYHKQVKEEAECNSFYLIDSSADKKLSYAYAVTAMNTAPSMSEGTKTSSWLPNNVYHNKKGNVRRRTHTALNKLKATLGLHAPVSGAENSTSETLGAEEIAKLRQFISLHPEKFASGGLRSRQRHLLDLIDAAHHSNPAGQDIHFHQVKHQPLSTCGMKIGEGLSMAQLHRLTTKGPDGKQKLTIYSRGHHVFYKEEEEGLMIPVLVLRFIPQDEFSVQDGYDWEILRTAMPKMYANSRECTSNAAFKNGKDSGASQGAIHSLGGNRNGYEAKKAFGTYTPADGLSREDFKRHVGMVKHFADIGQRRFNNLCPFAFATNTLLGKRVPSLEAYDNIDVIAFEDQRATFSSCTLSTNIEPEPEPEPQQCDATATTFTVEKAEKMVKLIQLFSNTRHVDNGVAGTFTFGITILVNSDGSAMNPSQHEQAQREIEGSHLVFPTLGVSIQLTGDGIMEQIWRGTTDPHLTSSGTSSDAFRRWGSSFQLNKKLVDRLQPESGSKLFNKNGEWQRARVKTVDEVWKKLKSRDMTVEERAAFDEEMATIEQKSDEWIENQAKRVRLLTRHSTDTAEHAAPPEDYVDV